jgi:hypothetical protein
MNNTTASFDSWQESVNHLVAPALRKAAEEMVPSIAALVGGMAKINQVRRAAAQRRRAGGGAADEGAIELSAATARDFHMALEALAPKLAGLLTPKLDFLLDTLGSEASALRRALGEVSAHMQFSPEEFDWLIDEAARMQFAVVSHLLGGDAAQLPLLLRGFSGHGADPLHFGFVAMTGEAATDQHLASLIARCRGKGVTASLFHLLPLIVTLGLIASTPGQLCPAVARHD